MKCKMSKMRVPAFALSPGMTTRLIEAAKTCGLAFVPGVMTPSEVMGCT
jgi:2-dehydro-3-deoxyphosphogluconate aldolase/(4S)-4-hydroxy-2-oxoglutarate aldolase